MSKAALNKTLKQMDNDDLRELILQVYDARKEAKEYLEFFLDPNIMKKREEATKVINKELDRYSKRKFACRISRIKKALKLFATYGPEDQMLVDLHTEVFLALCNRAQTEYFTQAFQNGSATFLTDLLKMIDKKGMFGEYFDRITKAVAQIATAHYDTRQFKKAMEEAIAEYGLTKALRP